MGFPGGIFQNGLSIRHGRCQHHIDGGADGDYVKENVSPFEMFRGGNGGAVFDGDGGAQGFKSLDMLINGPLADGAPALKIDGGLAESAEESADEVIGTAHGTDFFRSGIGSVNLRRIDGEGLAIPLHLTSEVLQYFNIGIDVCNIRHILQNTDTGGHQDTRQDGYRGILCAVDLHSALQSFSAVYHKFFHFITCIQS
ncbi:hypothetical protein DSECCO2_540580 [anaerobic digester metagenome]